VRVLKSSQVHALASVTRVCHHLHLAPLAVQVIEQQLAAGRALAGDAA
jgi:hypothetical protein